MSPGHCYYFDSPYSCSPPGLLSTSWPHDEPTSCLPGLICTSLVTCEFRRALPALSLWTLLTACTKLLALPPTQATILSSSSSEYISLPVRHLDTLNLFNDVRMMSLIICNNMLNNSDIPMTSLDSRVASL